MGGPVFIQQPTHPHRDAGIVLIILGVVLFIGGIAAASYCSLSFLGVCLDYPYSGIGALSVLTGIVLFIIGIVLAVISGPQTVVSGPSVVYVQPPQPTYIYQQPAYQTPSAPAPPPPHAAASISSAERYCQACGAGNQRASAFCEKCGKPLPPPR